MGDEFEGQGVSGRALAHDPFGRDVLEVVDAAERLALARVRQMDLHERQADALESVAKLNAGVGQATGVDDRPVKVAQV